MRLPLSTAERLAGQSKNVAWPPTMAYEAFEAGTKQMLGAFLRDESLVEEGRLQQAKLGELRRAAELEVKAEQTRAQADAELRTRQETADRQRTRVAQQTHQQEVAVEREKREAKQKADAEARRAEQTIAKVDEQREKQLEATERQARLVSVDAESKALRKERQAVASAEKVATLAAAVETKKAQRKNQSNG
jgi:hypothetical protein